MTRSRLPNRRRSVTATIAVDGWPPTLATIGLDHAGRAREVFLRAARPNSDVDRILDDAAVAVSLALQHGASARDVAASLGRRAGSPATPIGAALDLAVAIDEAP